jgi:dTDP-4-amino-4,6-dideoxygalactose transaminase
VSAGDEVIVPTLTFIAPVNAVSYTGAEPVFMDCDQYYNLDVKKTLNFLRNESDFKDGVTIDRKSGKRIAAVIPVHVFGNAVDLADLIPFCKERNIKVIEDATESLGTRYTSGSLKDMHSGTVGDMGILSFNGNKIMTTGGGGMILTKNPQYAEKARYLSTQAKDDPIRYIHNEIGYNYRLTNIQAALGVAQLEKMDEFVQRKKKNYLVYKESFNAIHGVDLAAAPDYADNNYWMYALQVKNAAKGSKRDGLMSYLAGKKIQTRPVWYLNHLQRPYRNCRSYEIIKSIELYDKTLNIPCSVGLSLTDLNLVVEDIRQFIQGKC